MLVTKLRQRSVLGRRRKSAEGFTLVELLVVITILGILAAVVIAAVSGIGDKGEESAKKTDLSIMQTAQEASCAARSMYDDLPQLRRDGFISAIGSYNDIDLEPLGGGATCLDKDGIERSYASWVPKKTAYPVTVKGCNGNSSTFTEAPKRPIVVSTWAHQTMILLGLADITMVATTNPANWALPFPKDLAGIGLPEVKVQETARRAVVDRGLARTYTSASPNFPAAIDVPGFLEGTGADLVVSDFVSWLRKNPTAALTETELTVQARGFKTYLGYGSNDNYKCFNSRVDSGNNPLPAETLEGLFDEIRDLATIFDVQERGMEVISAIKTRMGDALVRGREALGDRAVPVAALDQFALTFGSATSYAFGNTPLNAAIASAGGRNVFYDQFPQPNAAGAEQNALNAARVLAARPEILVLLDYTSDGSKAPDCTASTTFLNTNSATWMNVPAYANGRILCFNYNTFVGNKPSAAVDILRLADAIREVQ
ncbi:MAG: prepilin-type N-terminal cleavage/methylation domain-containing protein [Sporichthyaceae bacterium]